jgi:hypothetical protein
MAEYGIAQGYRGPVDKYTGGWLSRPAWLPRKPRRPLMSQVLGRSSYVRPVTEIPPLALRVPQGSRRP